MGTVRQPAAPGWRRAAAVGVDYAIVAIYLGMLALVGMLGRAAGLLQGDVTTLGGRIVGQLVTIAVLTVPVTLWFAWWEAAPRGATPGKRLLGLRVSRLDGSGLPGLARCCAHWPGSLCRGSWPTPGCGTAWPGRALRRR